MRHEVYLKHRLHTLHTLHDAVSAMRSLAAHHFTVVRKALSPARDYRSQIERMASEVGLHQVLSPNALPGMLVIASDLGLCGDYNSRIARSVLDERREFQTSPVYCVGKRLAATLARAGLNPTRRYEAAESNDGLASLLLQLAQDLLEDYLSAKIGSLYVISARFDGIGHFTPVRTRLLPIELPSSLAEPVRSPYVAADHLRSVVVREYLYISLYELLIDALAAEHGMRLTAAEGALQWLETATERTSRRLSASRSESATQELLDIVAGSGQRKRV